MNDYNKHLISEVKMLIQEFTDLTVEENRTNYINPDCDILWNTILSKLNELGGGV